MAAESGMLDLVTGTGSARILGVSHQGWRYLEAQHLLKPVAITPSGIKLFERRAVELLRDQRRAQRRRARRRQRTEAVNS